MKTTYTNKVLSVGGFLVAIAGLQIIRIKPFGRGQKRENDR